MKTSATCAFMLSLCTKSHLISLLLSSVLFSGWLLQTSRAQRPNNARYIFFLSAAELFILLSALFGCLYRRFNRVSTRRWRRCCHQQSKSHQWLRKQQRVSFAQQHLCSFEASTAPITGILKADWLACSVIICQRHKLPDGRFVPPDSR